MQAFGNTSFSGMKLVSMLGWVLQPFHENAKSLTKLCQIDPAL